MKRLTLLLALLPAACEPARNGQQEAAVDSAADSTAEQTYAGPKACELITVDQIKTVTALVVDTGKTVTDYMGDSQCRFGLVSDTAASLMVTLHAVGKIDPYQKVPGSVAVSGLGDAAVWNPSVFQLAAAQGQAVLSVAFLGIPQAKQSWATRLTRAALDKLQAP